VVLLRVPDLSGPYDVTDTGRQTRLETFENVLVIYRLCRVREDIIRYC
jgi:hypothetical protein